MEDQDGKATAPKKYLQWIGKTYGRRMLIAYHKIGRQHDRDIIRYGLKEANRRLRQNMKGSILPVLSVRLPTSLLTRLYRVLPKELQDLYHQLVGK